MTDPRIQNIPIRSDLGRELRKTLLLQPPARVLLEADFASLEQRLLAQVLKRQK